MRTLSRTARRLALSALAALLVPAAPAAAERFITVASTTSTQNSGLFDHILPRFTAATGIAVRVVAVGTGAALRLGRQGDADVVLVHARAAEDAFVAAGHGIERRDVMYNDFVLVGPAADPAGIGGLSDITQAFVGIARSNALFASRGDDSGTHKKETALWKAADVDPKGGSGAWYLETGSGMGATLNVAAGRDAYTLADRGTWLGFRNRGGLEILVEGDPRLRNPYGVILVNPARHAHVKAADGRAFIAWLTSKEGRDAIAAYRLEGQQAFFPSE